MARPREAKDLYRTLIKKYHPDRFGARYAHIQEWMKIINGVNETHLSRLQRPRAR